MTNTIDRDFFEDALANGGVLSEDIRSDYSGRGMFDRTCIGVVTDVPHRVGIALAQAAAQFREEASEVDELTEEDGWDAEEVDRLEEFAQKFDDLAASISTDSMGLDAIVYFPGWEFED